MKAQAWFRFGAESRWTTELDESDRLALVGVDPDDDALATERSKASDGVEEGTRICRRCFRRKAREEFRPDASRSSGLARDCGACFARSLGLAA